MRNSDFFPQAEDRMSLRFRKWVWKTLNASPAVHAVDLQLTTCEQSNAPAVDLDIYDTQPGAGTARDFVFYPSQPKHKIAAYKKGPFAHVKLTHDSFVKIPST